MTLHPDSPLPGYEAAHSGAAVYRVPDAGTLRIAGEDRADFIQRQTTNDVRALTPDTAQTTVLTSGTARILDVWRLLSAPDHDAINVITLPGRGAATARYLQKRIFFMDKVEVTDLSDETSQLVLVGPDSADILAALGLQMPDPAVVLRQALDDLPVTTIGPDGMLTAGVLLLVAADQADTLLNRLSAAGAARLSPEAVEVLRVELGQPGAVGELIDDYTPLEVTLDAAVSGTKGCYAGQEVIARQITYDKVSRRLVGLRLAGPVAVGARVEVDGRGAGIVTSAVISPRAGSIALAVLRRAYVEPGAVAVLGADAAPVAGTVTETLTAPGAVNQA